MKNFIKEFKEFAIQGNAVDLAVGVVIGAAFKAIIDAIVNDILNPLIAYIGSLFGGNVTGLVIPIGGVNLLIGDLIGAIINFFLIAFVLFSFIKFSNKMKRKKKEEEAAPEEPSEEIKLLTEIRDSLKK